MLFFVFRSMDFGVENIVQLFTLLIAWLSAFCFCSFFIYEAVSYTHLDVYKRQSLVWANKIAV